MAHWGSTPARHCLCHYILHKNLSWWSVKAILTFHLQSLSRCVATSLPLSKKKKKTWAGNKKIVYVPNCDWLIMRLWIRKVNQNSISTLFFCHAENDFKSSAMHVFNWRQKNTKVTTLINLCLYVLLTEKLFKVNLTNS